MAHKVYTVSDQRIPQRPSLDLNGDGVGDPIMQGYLSKTTCDKIAGCTLIDGYACAPTLKNGFDDPVPFSKAPASLRRLFADAAVFVFTQSTFTNRTLRFFPDDPDGGVHENPASFAVGQAAGYFDSGKKFIPFKIDGFAVGLKKEGTHNDTHLAPACDKTGRAIRIAYGKGSDGKTIEKPLSELIWADPEGQPIDPHVLITGGSKDRPLTESETILLPLFKKAQTLALKFKKLQQEKTGLRDLSGVRLTSLEIRRQARDEMEGMLRADFPHSLSPNYSLWGGVHIALGKVVGLQRADLTVPSIQEK